MLIIQVAYVRTFLFPPHYHYMYMLFVVKEINNNWSWKVINEYINQIKKTFYFIIIYYFMHWCCKTNKFLYKYIYLSTSLSKYIYYNNASISYKNTHTHTHSCNHKQYFCVLFFYLVHIHSSFLSKNIFCILEIFNQNNTPWPAHNQKQNTSSNNRNCMW